MARKAYKGIGMNGIIARWYAKTVEKDYEQYKQLDLSPRGRDFL